MKSILAVVACVAVALFAVSPRAQTERPAQTFKSSAGPIKITPVYHASLVIEAGGKVIVVDPANPPSSRPAAGRCDLLGGSSGDQWMSVARSASACAGP